MNSEENEKAKVHKKEFPIFINETKYMVSSERMTGAQLKQLGGIPAGNKLFKELHGHDPDQPIADDMMVELKPGDKFYDLPVGVVGERKDVENG